MLNQARLKVLKARDDHVSNVYEDAKKQLVTISQDPSRYPQLLEGLISQVWIYIISQGSRHKVWRLDYILKTLLYFFLYRGYVNYWNQMSIFVVGKLIFKWSRQQCLKPLLMLRTKCPKLTFKLQLIAKDFFQLTGKLKDKECWHNSNKRTLFCVQDNLYVPPFILVPEV